MRSGKYSKNTQIKILLIFVFVISISAGIFITLYINSLSNRDLSNRNLVLVHASSISIEETPIKEKECIITLNGYLPNPCWRLDHHEKEIYEQVKAVNITLWGYQKGFACIEIIQPFHYNVSILFPSSGNWTIFCNYISKNIIVLD